MDGPCLCQVSSEPSDWFRDPLSRLQADAEEQTAGPIPDVIHVGEGTRWNGGHGSDAVRLPVFRGRHGDAIPRRSVPRPVGRERASRREVDPHAPRAHAG